MNLLYLSITTTVLCTFIVFSLKYLPLLNWITGHAYVLSKRRKKYSILELLDLFKIVKPFPISCQKGWKIDSFAHGHRIWFNFLTFPHNLNAPSIKVYAVFSYIRSTSQSILQVLRNVSKSCEWKPGVISAASSHRPPSPDMLLSACGLPLLPIEVDYVKEEVLRHSKSRFSLQCRDTWFTENVVPTESQDYQRFWQEEESGTCWLLQMNEKLQACEFYLIQPLKELDQCLVSVVTWSRDPSSLSIDRSSVLFSSLAEYICLRKLHATPLTTMNSPTEMEENGESSRGHESVSQKGSLLSRMNSVISHKHASDNIVSRNLSSWNKKADLEKYLSILKYDCGNGRLAPVSSSSDVTATVSPTDVLTSGSVATSAVSPDRDSISDMADNEYKTKSALRRSASDGTAVTQSQIMNKEIEKKCRQNPPDNVDGGRREQETPCSLGSDESMTEQDRTIAHFKTTDNKCAAELLLETKRASEINLELSSDKQGECSGGWLFSSFEKNIVILKKIQRPGSTVQSYIGKGFILAPPKTVWDALRNPRTRFTYDETLKKVDIVAKLDDSLKIVYYYHENLQFLKKECCDMCILHGERRYGQKYIVTYSSIEHEKCPVNPDVTRAKMLPSGWIIEAAKQDNREYSIVTYLVQLDFGRYSESSDSLPFQEMVSHYPLSIADLQQYLRPEVQMLRQQSVA